MPSPLPIDPAPVTPSPRRARHRSVAIVGGSLLLVAILLAIGLAAFPWGLMRGTAERALVGRFGRPVTIGSVVRVDRFGFTPTVAVRDVRIAQPSWAGPGAFVRIREARATFAVWSLLMGRFRLGDVRLDGVRLSLVRTADGRTNWSRPGAPTGQRGGATVLAGLTISDAAVSYRDAKRDRAFVATVSSDPVHGIRAIGNGVVQTVPVTIAFTAPPVDAARGKPWPFAAAIDGAALTIHAHGTMDHALDTDGVTMDVTGHAQDLTLIDAVIEAGLFHSQPVALAAHVRRDGPDWRIDGLHGTIGRSDFDSDLTIDKADGRTDLAGRVAMRQLDFDDLSSDAGIARGAAAAQATGPRVVPDTRIDIRKIARTDGTIRFSVQQIVSRHGRSALVAASGTATMDHRVLTLAPLTLRLAGGVATGSVRIDQHGGGPAPVLTTDLLLRGSSLRALGASDGDSFTGSVAIRARLRGAGETVRAAVGASDGTIGFVVRDGSLPNGIAAALGFDAGRALLADRDDRAGLRCVVARLAVRGGTGRTDPLVVDTTESQMRGDGIVSFPSERIDVRLTGAPKRDALLKLPGVAYLEGTLSDPAIRIPPEVKSIGNILKAIGRAIKGTQGPLADDADCGALAAAALR